MKSSLQEQTTFAGIVAPNSSSIQTGVSRKTGFASFTQPVEIDRRQNAQLVLMATLLQSDEITSS
jgi:hypothetical protein